VGNGLAPGMSIAALHARQGLCVLQCRVGCFAVCGTDVTGQA
jgi:hypothetical protein